MNLSTLLGFNIWFFKLNPKLISTGRIEAHVHRCGVALVLWNRESIGNIRGRITKLKKDMEDCYVTGIRIGNSSTFVDCKNELSKLLQDEEVLWRQ